VKTLHLLSDKWKRYLIFILWGLIHGAFVNVVLIPLMPSSLAYPQTWIISMGGGSLISAMVFGGLFNAPRWLQSLGFPVAGVLMPYLFMTTLASLDQRRFVQLDPLAILFVLFWTVTTLPFALLAAIAYFLLWPKARDDLNHAPSSRLTLAVRLKRSFGAGIVSTVLCCVLMISISLAPHGSPDASAYYWIEYWSWRVLTMLAMPGWGFVFLLAHIAHSNLNYGILLGLAANLVLWFFLGAIPGFVFRQNKLVVILWFVLAVIVDLLGWKIFDVLTNL